MNDLRQKIDEAKNRLPLPELMRQLGYDEKHICRTALCPFHCDQPPSFSVLQKSGAWFHWRFVGCSLGDSVGWLGVIAMMQEQLLRKGCTAEPACA
jgi:hypothetical protein